VIQDTSALTSVRLARALRRAIVGLLLSALLTPLAYYLAVLVMAGSSAMSDREEGFVVLATFQYQVSPGFALFPNVALLLGVALLGVPRLAPWLRTAIVLGGAVLAALATWLIAGAPSPVPPHLVAVCAALVAGWTLAAVPASSKKPGWGRP